MASQNEISKLHIFLVSFPGQGHVNPLLRLGKILASKGHLVTLSAPELIGREIRKANGITDDQPAKFGKGTIRLEFFDDEWEVVKNESKPQDFNSYLNHLEQKGRQNLLEMLKKHEEKGPPVSCMIINPFLPWVFDVAETLQIPSATLWVQSCASFSAYYHYHCNLVPFPTESEPEIDVQLPGMPVLKYDEIPSILHPRTPFPFMRKAISANFDNLSKNFCILMDTFYELENEIIDNMSKLCPIKPIGPMFKIPNDSSSDVSVDTIKADDCKEWLDSKPVSSVVYISFGSIVFLKQEQVTELAYGILNSGFNFLWVMRPPTKGTGSHPHVLPEELLQNSRDKGKVVQWSLQEQVLAHPSIACFITHCGWNSTLEAITCGVPVVTLPQWADQVTNAKYLVEEFKIGVRLSRGEAENMIVSRKEVENCVREIIDGPKAIEIKEKASEWKRKAETAIGPGGSSKTNIDSFLDQVTKICETKSEPQLSNLG